MGELPFREIHLDFHTSPDINDVGSEFNPEEFGRILTEARVNSITCFARCHHGMVYYQSRRNPERIHPGLGGRDLLREQIEVCHKLGIRVPVYTTVQWDYFTSREHPEWNIRTEDGGIEGQDYYSAGFYRGLCVNTPYRDFLKEHVREIVETLPTDGIFFDIVGIRDCSCEACRKSMVEQGLKPHLKADRLRFATGLVGEFMRDMSAFVRDLNSDCSIFYNSGHIGTAQTPLADAYTHFELESLPSGSWGYQSFPLSMRYARNFNLDCLSQTGKFHTSWGDFHSFKNRAALEFECFRMLALGAKCMVGDQLQPSGKLSPEVYRLIGSVYRGVEEKEAWCSGVKAIVDIGVLDPAEFRLVDELEPDTALIGAGRMLQECAHQFDVIDSNRDFSKYRVIVLPDTINVSPELDEKLSRYLAEGGAVISSFESGLSPSGESFRFSAAGVSVKREQTRDVEGNLVRGRRYAHNDYADYVVPRGAIGAGLPETEHVMYMRGLEVEAAPCAEVLMDTVMPYFDRDYRHFCSHMQTPSSGRRGYAAVIRNGRSIYFAHPIFRQYDANAPRWCKTLFLNALHQLLPAPVLRHSGPTGILSSLTEQAAESRLIAHFLYYVPERRSREIDTIEDVVPLYDVKASIRLDGRKVRKASLVPQGRELAIAIVEERIEFCIPEIIGHQMVCIDLER
jgi:hypothetical protein